MTPDLSIVIIVGNESEMITECIKTCMFAKEIILVTTITSDDTVSKAKSICENIIVQKAKTNSVDFSYWRNFGAKVAKSNWILYIDADERITPELQNEINNVITSNKYSSYDIPRANYFLGHRVAHGNTYPDYVKRLFKKNNFRGFTGKLHEQPTVIGPSYKLNSYFLHFTHRDLKSMLEKSLYWTPIESKLLFDSNHPPVVWWRFIRMMLTKFWERLVFQSMWRDGTVGWISAVFETFDTFLIYCQLWELQQKRIIKT
jgi:glycosyltransferase involved in cell wall biosynthesis